jgi:acetyltransferase-like isoleucine patch superfamily enzyme
MLIKSTKTRLIKNKRSLMRDPFSSVMIEVFNFLWKYPRVHEHRSTNRFDKNWRGHPRINVHETVECDGEVVINVGSGYITIGEYSFLGQRCMFIAGNHDVTKRNKARKDSIPDTGYDINIGKGVFIGSGAIVLGPCTIGDHAVIGAGSVVTAGEYEGDCLYAGNPAVFKKRINSTE